jgi:hypothetical protein
LPGEARERSAALHPLAHSYNNEGDGALAACLLAFLQMGQIYPQEKKTAEDLLARLKR